MSFNSTFITAILITVAGVSSVQASYVVENPEPEIMVTVGGAEYQVPADFFAFTNIGLFQLATPWIQRLANNAGQVSIDDFKSNSDPSMAFTIGATNDTNNPLTYSFSLNSAISPALTWFINSSSSLNETLSTSNAGTGYVTPVADHLLMTSYDIKPDGSQVSKNVDIGTGFSHLFPAAGGTAFNTEISKYGSLDCGSNSANKCETMSAVLSFILSPHSSVAITGTLAQVAAPVPSAIWLLGSALAVFCVFCKRRVASKAGLDNTPYLVG